MYPFAYWYHEQGYHVLVPDLRCQGESEGDFIGMGWTDSFDCAYTSAYDMFGDKITEWFGLPEFPFVDSACLMLRLRGGYDLKDASAIDAVKKSATPTLFIHGEKDAMIDVSMSKELYESAVCAKELLIVEGAGHAQSQDKAPDEYYGTIARFLADHGL